MSWISSWYKKLFPRPIEVTGTEKLVAMLTEQVCNWFETLPQEPPKVVVYAEAKSPVAIYNYNKDTIFVYGTENVTPEILAHEVAHAVICGIQGSITPKMQEILAGYAEYKIRQVTEKKEI
jgi:hypothetical protein